jgi:L-fuculose-phosphate aldolase
MENEKELRVKTIAEQIVATGKLMFDRHLADISGGNISVRQGDRIYITPTGAGQKWLWQLTPEDILSAPVDTDELMQNPQHSKESISHLIAYRAFPELGAIIHAHPFHVMPFLVTHKPIQSHTLAARRYGQLEFIPDAPLYSREQGELIVQALCTKRELMAQWATGVLMPNHGVFVVGKNLLTALDCLERIDNSAFCNLALKFAE